MVIIFNATQARTDSLAHNKELQNILEQIKNSIVKSVEEGKFETEDIIFPKSTIGSNKVVIEQYFNALGYSCSCTNIINEGICIKVNWY